MEKFSLVFVFVLLLSSAAFAQNIDKVIIVSDITSADFVIAKAAADKAGIPVLIAQNGEASEELRAQLGDTNLNPKIVILIGGPVVIKPEAEKAIQDWGYLAVRLWGVERTGTSLEAAKYFWQEGSDCAVLADDTRNSDADTESQEDAAVLAAQEKCPLLLVPKGKIPAEVLDLLRDAGVSRVHVVGVDSAERREHLANFEKRFLAKKDIESEILSKAKAKIVIVAALHWRDVLGTGGVPSENSVVRIVNNADQSQSLIDLITSRNITDVRVVGNPELAQQIFERLNGSGIVVKKTSGRHSEVALKEFREHLEKWKEKLQREKDRLNEKREKIRSKLFERVNETEKKLADIEVELEEIAAGAPPEAADLISRTKEDIAVAKSSLAQVRERIGAGQFDDARRLLHHIHSVVKKDMHLLRKLLKFEERIVKEIEEEEQETDEAEEETSDELSETDKVLARIERCVGKDDIAALVAKAKSLHEELQKAKAEGNQTKAARLIIEARDVSAHAKALGDLCKKRGEISEKLRKIAKERSELAERVREKVAERAEEKFEVKLEELPGKINAGQNFVVSWKVKSPRRFTITHTAVHYDYASHEGDFGADIAPAASGYPSLTQEYASGSFIVPDTFRATITPDKEGVLYLRAHAIFEGNNYWTDEKKVDVKMSSSDSSY